MLSDTSLIMLIVIVLEVLNQMPDELCRKCGCTIITCSICCKCKQSIQKICIKCGVQTILQFHDACFYEVETIQTSSVVTSMSC